MSEIIADKKVFSLSEVLLSIQKTLIQRYASSFWVKAEMNKLNFYKHSGHCYPDLVEKTDGKVVAEIRSVLWNSDYSRINLKFLTILQEPLKDGIKILLNAKVSFDPKYGLSLHILDIDPSFTLGDLEKEKQETILRLKSEGIFESNKKIPFPVLPQRIAIVSVETSKGYADFQSVTIHNPWGYKFFYFLFPSLLQGEQAASSIITQMKRIRKAIRYFDVVAIIRGGGGDVGLTCYNNYELAKFICTFPIPVITGIGHSTNETVAEMVANVNAITPTKLAEYLIQYFHNFSVPVKEAENKISAYANHLISEQRTNLTAYARLFKSVTRRAMANHQFAVNSHAQVLSRQAYIMLYRKQEELKGIQKETALRVGLHIKDKRAALNNIEKNISILHPSNVLRRGYSITMLRGKVLTDVTNIKNNDEVKTFLLNGSFSSTVSKTFINSPDNE